MSSIAQSFEELIDDDCSVITVKINNIPIDPSSNQMVRGSINSFAIPKYIRDLGVEIIFSSCGVHLQGENGVPHAHWHFITTPLDVDKNKTALSNPSLHRRRWMVKNDEIGAFENVSFSIKQRIDNTTPKYSTLAYPLKEGILLDHYKNVFYMGLNDEWIEFLKNTGVMIYQTELAVKLRLDKCKEKRMVALADLYEICEKNRASFYDFKTMCKYLDENFIGTLDLDELPDPKNYKVNLQKIAIKLKILKYSDLII